MELLSTQTPLGTAGRVTRYEGNLVLMLAPEGARIQVEDVREDLKHISLLARGEPVRLIVDGRGTVSMSIAARRLVGSPALVECGVVAVAGMVGSRLSRIVGEFQMRFHPPHAPTRVFVDEQDALDWIAGMPLFDDAHARLQ